MSTSSNTPVTWPLKRLSETVLTQFDTDDPRQCFIQCSNTPICIGQDILHYQSGTYSCRLLTIAGVTYASAPNNLVSFSIILLFSPVIALVLLPINTSLQDNQMHKLVLISYVRFRELHAKLVAKCSS